MMDLGGGYYRLRFHSWAPDRDLNPQYAHLPDVERYGATVRHPLRAGDPQRHCLERGFCEAAITFAGPVQAEVEPGREVWDVQSWEPLTISPSLLCHCGEHGFIRQGRWVPA